MDLALQEDARFDEVGPAGKVLWYLERLEPEGVSETPQFWRYKEVECDHSVDPSMLVLVENLDDELSNITAKTGCGKGCFCAPAVSSSAGGHIAVDFAGEAFFPTAYEARSHSLHPGGSVRSVKDLRLGRQGLWLCLRTRNLVPAARVDARQYSPGAAGKGPGEVIIHAETQRSRRDWVRTVLVGTDGGMVFAMLKQVVTGSL